MLAFWCVFVFIFLTNLLGIRNICISLQNPCFFLFEYRIFVYESQYIYLRVYCGCEFWLFPVWCVWERYIVYCRIEIQWTKSWFIFDIILCDYNSYCVYYITFPNNLYLTWYFYKHINFLLFYNNSFSKSQFASYRKLNSWVIENYSDA